MKKEFPYNLYEDLGVTVEEQPADFMGSLMYVLRTVATPRGAKAILLRYQNGKNYDEIGDILEITKQRAHSLTQEVLAQITGEHVLMLTKGIKAYMEETLQDRIADLKNLLEDSERETLKTESYNEGYENGYKDGSLNMQKNPVNREAIYSIKLASLSLSYKTRNTCMKNGIFTIGDVLQCGDNILACYSFGKKCFTELITVIKVYGINPHVYFPRAMEKFGLEA